MAAVAVGVHGSGRLLVPVRTRHAQLLLGVSHAEVVDGRRSLLLPWDSVGDPETERSVWTIGPAVQTRGGAHGLGVALAGDLRREAYATFGEPSLVAQLLGLVDDRTVVLSRRSGPLWRASALHQTLAMLCRVVAEQTAWRAGLGDPARVARLADDLNRRAVVVVVEGSPLRRATVEAVTALQRSGFVHRYGRPLDGDVLPSVDHVVATTRAFVDRNPYARGVEVSDDLLREVAERDYLGVEPWPFGALRPDGP